MWLHFVSFQEDHSHRLNRYGSLLYGIFSKSEEIRTKYEHSRGSSFTPLRKVSLSVCCILRISQLFSYILRRHTYCSFLKMKSILPLFNGTEMFRGQCCQCCQHSLSYKNRNHSLIPYFLQVELFVGCFPSTPTSSK